MMNTTFLLVLLALGDGGQINAGFVNTDSLNLCQNKSKILSAVISTSGSEIIENRCISSELVFSKFDHSEEEKTVRYSYYVSLIDENIVIKQFNNQAECVAEKKKQASVNSGNVHCVTSSQKMMEH